MAGCHLWVPGSVRKQTKLNKNKKGQAVKPLLAFPGSLHEAENQTQVSGHVLKPEGDARQQRGGHKKRRNNGRTP